jgi:hypothetical protein
VSRRSILTVRIILLAVFTASRLCADLVLPGSWDVGTIGDTAAVSRTITLQNTGRNPLVIRLLSSCSCLTVQPEQLQLGAGAAASVRLTLDPAGLSGGISKLVLAKVENGEGLDRLLAVNGTVRSKTPPTARQETECEWCKKLSADLRKQAYDSWRKREGVLHYYYSADCRTCTDFLDTEIPRVEKVIGRAIEVPGVEDATPLGAAMLAGIGVGQYRDEKDAYEHVKKAGAVYEPDPGRTARYSEWFPI